MYRFKDGDRVCFVGDSLVAHNKTLPYIIDNYRRAFPEEDIRFFNCGTSGGTYRSAINFFKDDIASHKPTHAVIAYGINDSLRTLLADERTAERSKRLHEAYENYKKNLDECCNLMLANGIKIILCTPAPYDEYSEGPTKAFRGGFALMQGYSEFVRKYAAEKGFELCDYNKYISLELETDTESIYNDDRVHPNLHGYYLMARGFLDFQGITAIEEAEIPDYLSAWSDTVRRLRVIFGTEHMIIKNYALPYEEKMQMMQKRIDTNNWGQPVFEGFIRGFVKEKPNQEALYKEIDELYEKDVAKHYCSK